MVVKTLSAKDLVDKASGLKKNWSTRDKKIRDWYKILRLTDELAQEGMETVTANDPRTGYNLGKHLMTSSIMAHKIATEELASEEISATSYLESYITKRWRAVESLYRRTGRQSFIGKMVGFMLATGWYSIFSMVTDDQIMCEVWNPLEVYPEFGESGLVEVSHIYRMHPAVANRKAKLMGWATKSPFTHDVNLYDYWGFDLDGDVVNGIVLGSEYVKPIEKDAFLTDLSMKLGVGILPVFISPVGGLPDEGAIDSKWQEHFGESIVATNEDLTKNYNKMLSFTQQLVRTAANPHYIELSSGETPIMTEENMKAWGSILRGAPGEILQPMLAPVIPVELRTTMFTYENMIQRGLFPWLLYGNIQQQLSYLAMANVASSALQVLTPYMDGLKGALADIDNFQFNMMKVNGFRPYKFKMPKDLPEEFEFEVQAEIEIPGYLVQRATVARMLDPTFRLPTEMVMDKLFPEVRDPLRTMAKIRRDDAMMHPRAILVDQILAYKEQVRILFNAGNKEAAALYGKLATLMEAELDVPTTSTKPAVAPEQEVPREVFPTREGTQPLEGLGGI